MAPHTGLETPSLSESTYELNVKEQRPVYHMNEEGHSSPLPLVYVRSPLGLVKILIAMADVFSKSKRSEVMAAIRSSGNRDTELKLALLFRKSGITGWRRNQAVYGKPDFVFRRQKIAVFVDGCFWHGCRWHCRRPKSRIDFWHPKIMKNQNRDKKVNLMLKAEGWHVIRIWEHTLREPEQIVMRVQATLASRRQKE